MYKIFEKTWPLLSILLTVILLASLWNVHLTNSIPDEGNQTDWNQKYDWDTFLNAFTDHGNRGYDALWVDVPTERFEYVDEK